MFRGEFRFLYERKIVHGLNVEFGLGAPFTSDYVNYISARIMGGLWNDSDAELYYSVLPLHVMLDNGSFDSGLLYSIALRYYFVDGNNAPSFIDFSYKNVNQTIT